MNPAYSELNGKAISQGTNKQHLAFRSTIISLNKNNRLTFEQEIIHFWSLLKLQSFTQSVWPCKMNIVMLIINDYLTGWFRSRGSLSWQRCGQQQNSFAGFYTIYPQPSVIGDMNSWKATKTKQHWQFWLAGSSTFRENFWQQFSTSQMTKVWSYDEDTSILPAIATKWQILLSLNGIGKLDKHQISPKLNPTLQ